MSQQQERLPFFLNCEALGTAPLAAFEPWLKAQSGMVASLRQMTDHWCERRAGDIATLQETAARLAGCTTPQSVLEIQARCAATLAERFMADLSAWSNDLMSVGASATASLSHPTSAPAPGKSATKAAAA